MRKINIPGPVRPDAILPGTSEPLGWGLRPLLRTCPITGHLKRTDYWGEGEGGGERGWGRTHLKVCPPWDSSFPVHRENLENTNGNEILRPGQQELLSSKVLGTIFDKEAKY